MMLTAKAVKYGDDINTDLIIAGKHTKTLNIADLAAYCMEDLDPDFHAKCKVGDTIVVAGDYFGCGSSREQAPIALKECGVKCVVASSFSRIFYRNAVNIGLPIVECDTSEICDGDILEYEIGSDTLLDRTKGLELRVMPLPELMVSILAKGGMVEYLKVHGGFDDLNGSR